MDQELQQELLILESNLMQVRDKFLKEWTGETFKKILSTRKYEFDNSIQRGSDSIKELEQNICEVSDKQSKLCQDKLEMKKEISSLEKELSLLSIQNEQLSKKKVLREKQLNDQKNYVDQEEKAIKKAKEKTVLKMNQYTKGIKFFQNNLGFTFKKIDDDHLQFVFKYIDPEDHAAPFIFTVKVDENGKYEVKDCSPRIDQLSVLIEELNKTNDFSKFVICVRQGFKDLVRKV